MKIERFEAVDRCLFWKEKKILVFSDLHLGYEELLFEQGLNFSMSQIEESEKILKNIFDKIGKVKKIIILGDVKHYFAGILNQEFGDFYKLINLLEKELLKHGEIIIVKGNHNNILEPILNQKVFKFIKLRDFYINDRVVFCMDISWDLKK